MSSDESRTTSSSRLSQFGLYRTIDARTEEFLRLSRKRQIRQGCACAAVSTAITVTVVVVILLIYEYAIAVESSLVQRNRWLKLSNSTNETNGNPIADRLYRSYFGFDQDYYERMPLLVNAMQENSYVEPSVENVASKGRSRYVIANYTKPTTKTANYRTTSIRRTSPRPFIFEYRHPTPTPFSKTYGSRSWVESYRNAQRLKNLQQVIKYLEKTINAKFGDMYTLPTSTIAFSGVYVQPMAKNTSQEPKTTSPAIDLLSQSSNKAETFRANHQSDPLFSFKPESPGDVNLLADGFFRFSPAAAPIVTKEKAFTTVPMFRPIRHRNRNCVGIACNENVNSKVTNVLSSGEVKSPETSPLEKPKSFSVMLNLFPLNPDNLDYKKLDTLDNIQSGVHKLFLTTTRPPIQFRRRSTVPIRRTTTRYKRPRFFVTNKTHKEDNPMNFNTKHKSDNEPKMIVHVNVYSPVEVKNVDSTTAESVTSTTQVTTRRYVTEIPMLTSTQVEDYHVGSSGIIPVEARLTPVPPPPIPTLPTVTTLLPFFDTITSSTEAHSWPTKAPEVIKFSKEDAKVPDQYRKLLNLDESDVDCNNENVGSNDKHNKNTQPEMNRRNYQESFQNRDEYVNVEPRTLIVKLKNEMETTTQELRRSTRATEEITTAEHIENNKDTTTVRTYVPQINGHYRSVNQNSKHINSWLDNSESNRKRRLEMHVTGIRKPTYVPQYVEIKRNNTKIHRDNDEDDS